MKPIKDPTELSGVLGESVTMRKINGRVVITNRPARKASANLSEKQTAVNLKFKAAVLWAEGQLTKPDVKARYQSKTTAKLKSAFVVALTDYLTPPQVQLIDTLAYKGTAGDVIVTKAIDDFIITRIDVVITGATGAVLEQGSAIQDADSVFLWNYAATVANPTLAGTKISVTAYDSAHNSTVLEKVL